MPTGGFILAFPSRGRWHGIAVTDEVSPLTNYRHSEHSEESHNQWQRRLPPHSLVSLLLEEKVSAKLTDEVSPPAGGVISRSALKTLSF